MSTPNPRFTLVTYGSGFEDAEVVYDHLTHLLWERKMREEKQLRNFDQARSDCESLSLSGYPAGWRLPTRIELASLVDYEKSTPPTIDAAAFPWLEGTLGEVVETFWSSSPSAKDPNEAWIVAFNSGLVITTQRSFEKNFRCVR
jgi:hypothetical protein